MPAFTPPDQNSSNFRSSPEPVHEPIRVVVDFSPLPGAQRVRPLAFLWGGKKYHIKKLNLRYKRQQGKRFLWCFAVSDEANSYTLEYDPEELHWNLIEVYLS